MDDAEQILAKQIASYQPGSYQLVQDENGKVRKYFIQNPIGNRRQRRVSQKHHPFFTKRRHKGREWHQLREASRSRPSESEE
jgi:hypothetical protein